MRFLDRLGVLALGAFAALSGAQSGDSGISSTNATDNHPTSRASISPSSIIPAVPFATSKPSNATCLSRTANYITHTLPQQCLRTDRSTANATRIPGSDEKITSTGSDVDSSLTTTTTIGTSISPSEATGQHSTEDQQIASAPSTRPLIGSGSAETALPAPTDIAVDSSTTLSGAVGESDSPLDNANFLSFEEWKRQNEAKAEHAADQPFVGDRQRPGINNALDSLGDEGEIELDFSGFGNGASAPRQQQAAYRTAEGAASAASAAAESYTPRSKDAGKTCKERTNYASFDCAATVLKTNPECKSAPSVLVENKDSYMLNICSATNKFFIVELCNDILIDTVVLANYEFFSSIFRHFRVSVSDRYPVKMDRWTDLGTFEARNTREVQAFLIEQPQIWTRYLRIEFLSHYGGEYYCPVSLLRVHGTTMLEELRPEEEPAVGEDAELAHAQKGEATIPPSGSEESTSTTDPSEKSRVETEGQAEVLPTVPESQSLGNMAAVSPSDPTSSSAASPVSSDNIAKEVMTGMPSYRNDSLTCAIMSSSVDRENPRQSSDSVQPPQATMESDMARTHLQENATASTEISSLVKAGPSTSPNTEASSTARRSATVYSPSSKADNQTVDTALHSPTITANSSATIIDRSSKQSDSHQPPAQSSTNSTRSTGTATSSVSPPQPSTQESFFKSIQKRLAQLEANSTLSLQYIEEQSRILRDAFSKVEKRQISATTAFLTNLNDTVMAELRGFRIAYDQIWQSTVLELEGQREQYQREILAISTRLTLVADELVWQKRMGIVQSTLVLLCLGLVLFARSGGGGPGTNYFEVPLMQQMLNKSQTSLSKTRSYNDWDQSPPASPSPESRSPGSASRPKLPWRSFTEPPGAPGAGDSGTDSRPASKDGSPYAFRKHLVDVKVQPPTPERNGAAAIRGSESTLEDDDDDDGDDGEVYEEAGKDSAPPTPEATRSTTSSGGVA